MGKMIHGTYQQFVDRTKEAVEHYEQGIADADDIAQIGYAAEQGASHVNTYAYPGYKVTFEREQQLMRHAAGIVEDSQSDEEETFKDVKPRSSWW